MKNTSIIEKHGITEKNIKIANYSTLLDNKITVI